MTGADWSWTCEGCAYVVDAPAGKGKLWARCFAPGPYRGVRGQLRRAVPALCARVVPQRKAAGGIVP